MKQLGTLSVSVVTNFKKKRVRFVDSINKDEIEPEGYNYPGDVIESSGIKHGCENCGSEWKGVINKIEAGFLITLQDSGGNQILPSFYSRESLELEASEGKRIMDQLYEMGISGEILSYYKSQLEGALKSRQLALPQDNVIKIIAYIKAYLSESYSFKRTFKTITKEGIPEKNRANKLFNEYTEKSEIVRGLRIYIQKERNINPKFIWKEEEIARPIIELDTVRTLDSQIDEEPPDGYRYGSDTYYGNITDDRIDLLKTIREHYSNVEWFNEQLISATIGEDSEDRDKIEEWIELRKKFDQRLSVQNIDRSDTS